MSQKYYSEIVTEMSMAAMLDGRLFRWFNKFELPISGTKEFLIKIPDDPTILLFHGRLFSSKTSGCDLDIYINPTFSDPGTPNNNFFNLEGNSIKSPNALIWEDPTITSDGILADVDTTYGTVDTGSGNKGSTGSQTTREFPRIMPKSVYILARVTNLSALNTASVIYKLFWEEIN